MRIQAIFFLCAFCASAEVRTMTLRQALEVALAQNPDVMLARLDQQKARYQVTIAHDPFVPKVFAGTGAAWTSGFPASIDGAAPSIVQAKTQMALYDKPQRYQVAQANENLRASGIEIGRQQDEVAYRVASLFLDAEQAARSLEAVQREAENLNRVRELVEAQVSEGRVLPIVSRRANLDVVRARQRVDALSLDLLSAESSLALALVLKPDDRVQAAQEERPAFVVPASEEQTIREAIENSRELKKLESNVQAKTLEIKGYKAMRYPKVNLVAQDEVFAKYYYQNYFSKFQRNSVQLGASIEVPLLVGRSPRAYMSQAEADIAKIQIEVDRARARIAADIRRAFQDVKRSESARDVARLDLDLAREQLSIDLAQMSEGRLLMTAVEQSRAVEQEKWLAYYEALHAAETARLNLLRHSGTLLAALK